MYKICFSLLLLLFSLNVSAQFTLSGTLKDGETGEDLIGARILVDEMPGTGAITNVYGFFSLTFKEPGTYNLTIKSIGFETQNVEVVMDKSQTLDLEMKPEGKILNAVQVTGEKQDENITSAEMGVDKIQMKDIDNIPVLFGEKDVL